jgi:glycine/D-amino acid oxidase-like deaminating enzyme/nitrite reductase/ring-hydroxylating ferredoxin subunit
MSRSPWIDEISGKTSGPMPQQLRCQVCVVGAGISGLSVAVNLARRGRDVVVLDAASHTGAGNTGFTTAHLASALDDRFSRLEKLHGAEATQLAAQSHAAAIDWIERLVTEEGIDCDFARLDGYLFAPDAAGHQLLEEELPAASRAGLGVEMVAELPILGLAPGPALRFARQGQLDPGKYLRGLARVARQAGVRIHCGVRVVSVTGGEPARVETADGGVVEADHVVVATSSPINNRFSLHTKQAAYRTYAVGFAVPRGELPRVLLWDTEDPYHYVRIASLDEEEDLLIVGGEDHKTGQNSQPELCWDRLAAWTRARFPRVRDERFRWSGQVLEPADGLAFIGRNPHDEPNVYVVSGDSGHGMTHGTLAGLLLPDLIEGLASPWEKVYDPKRVRGLSDMARENLNTMAAYTDWLAPSHASVEHIPPGQGAVVRRGLRRLAVHRDLEGHLHVMDAACPHLGAVLQWNPAEQSWDCPAHGSRFDACGGCIHGPAISDMKPREEKRAPGERGSDVERGQR